MYKYLKIFVIMLFVLLVVFGAIADRPVVEQFFGGLHLAPYLRAISILGMVVAVFLAWGYKRKIEASQKYVRAQEILTEAGEKAERAKRESERLEEKRQADYEQKKIDLDEQISQMKQTYEERIRALKEQNIALKESVGKLMQMVKKNKVS